ncbi:MAG TPA: hypothetical protein VM889_12820 [Candidatus Thermoplasmatota archaeon]|nr:hypothetical protein [Candidatus Thermoplasmatota archaeon]
MRFLLPLLVVALVALPLASAQTIVRPPSGAWHDLYFVSGRVVDAQGLPAVNQKAVISFDVAGATVKPLTTTITCAGDFTATFPIRDVRRGGTVTLEIDGQRITQKVDTHLRRTDFEVELGRRVDNQCSQIFDVWHARFTVTGRVIESVAGHDVNGTRYFARPLPQRLMGVVILFPDGVNRPAPEPIVTNEYGDYKYSFTFHDNFTIAKVVITIADKKYESFIDNRTRIAVANFDLGDPSLDRSAIPMPGAALAGLALALAVGLGGRRARRD